VHPAASLELRLQNPQATASELVADPEVASRIRGALAALREPLAETNGFAELLQDFPEFLRSECTRIESGERFDRGAAEGHAFESLAGSQIVLWSASEGGERALDHVHDFDEYVVVVAGQYTVHQGGTSVLLRPGDELLLPAGVPHSGQALPGTRTLHAYGGKRFALRGKP
jgi:quercetin dioxygenase-like cupin family protein